MVQIFTQIAMLKASVLSYHRLQTRQPTWTDELVVRGGACFRLLPVYNTRGPFHKGSMLPVPIGLERHNNADEMTRLYRGIRTGFFVVASLGLYPFGLPRSWRYARNSNFPYTLI